jgi:RNA polymerase sigma-70 factor (ECF subfamily)
VKPASIAPSAGADATARSDIQLAAALGAADGTALAEVYDRFHRAVYSVAFRVTADRHHAEDVVQEVFVALWRKPSSYDPQRASLGTWLTSASHHKSVDLVRREESLRRRRDQVALGVEQTLRDDVDRDPVDEVAGERWRATRVRRAMAELPETQRQALVLAYFGGYTQREVAALTGVPLGTVKTRTLTAMRKLKDVLAYLHVEEAQAAHGAEGSES